MEIMNKYKFIISANQSGLGNRIKCLVTSMEASKILGLPLLIYWQKNQVCFCDYKDIFENNNDVISDERFKFLRKNTDYLIIDTWRLTTFLETFQGCNFLNSESFSNDFNSKEKGYFDFKYNKLSEDQKIYFKQYFNKLQIKKELTTKAEDFFSLNLNNVSAYSIRTWYEAPQRRILFDYPTLEGLIGLEQNNKVFINCDSKEITDKLISKFGNKIICFPKQTFHGDRYSEIGMQDTLIDLLLVSMSKNIKLSYLSSFPEIAWWIGGCTDNVTYLESEKRIDLYHKISKYYNINRSKNLNEMYSKEFYKNQQENISGKKTSEKIIHHIIKKFSPKSIIDIGCGVGTFLLAAEKKGISVLTGVDFYPVDEDLVITSEKFRRINITEPFNLDQKFDIALCLEVAEHLHEEFAQILIKNLIKHSDIIIFSAAIPLQGGTNHFNEQWQDYWIQQFNFHNYSPSFDFRELIWNDDEIISIYKQNIVVFVNNSIKETVDLNFNNTNLSSVVHPDVFLWKVETLQGELNNIISGKIGIKYTFRLFLLAIKNFIFKNFIFKNK